MATKTLYPTVRGRFPSCGNEKRPATVGRLKRTGRTVIIPRPSSRTSNALGDPQRLRVETRASCTPPRPGRLGHRLSLPGRDRDGRAPFSSGRQPQTRALPSVKIALPVTVVDKRGTFVKQADFKLAFDKEGKVEAHVEEAHHHHHHHDDDVEVNPAAWSDGKRYAWLLGILVPLAPFMAWGAVEATGFGGFWFARPGPRLRRSSRCSTWRSGSTRRTRPTRCSSGSSRTTTTAGAPTCSSRSSTPG